MKEHKHAEILRAIADGKEVEYFNTPNNSWQEMSFITPLTYPEFDWRIKTKPKPPIIRELQTILDDFDIMIVGMGTPNTRFTFDPDTRLPIKVELI